METSRHSYQQEMETQLKIWDTQLKTLHAKLEKAAISTKNELLTELEELKKLQHEGKEQLEYIKATSDAAWNTIKTELADKWDRVSGTADALLDRIKKSARH